MTHADHILAAMERFRCIHCGTPVGREARGSSECLPCLVRIDDLTDQGVQIPINQSVSVHS